MTDSGRYFFGVPGGAAQWWRSLAEWAGPPAIYLNNRGLIMPRALFGEIIRRIDQLRPKPL